MASHGLFCFSPDDAEYVRGRQIGKTPAQFSGNPQVAHPGVQSTLSIIILYSNFPCANPTAIAGAEKPDHRAASRRQDFVNWV